MKNKKKILLLLVLIALVFTLSGCASQAYMKEPLGKGFGFWDIFVYPMAAIMWLVAKTIGFGSYAITLIISTIIVRTLGWPIYAKSNDMQLKMTLVQPEMAKIQKRYEGKEDPQSKQQMQMETMQLYKKYGIGIGGCILPLLQMPIFLGFYYAIRKIPACMGVDGHWLNIFGDSTTLFGIDLTKTMTEAGGGSFQKGGVIVLAVLVAITQVISIVLSMVRQKKQKEQQESTVPEYRKSKNQQGQAKTGQKTMQYMMFFMAAMMVVFVLQSPAGLGLYWVIGNIYTTFQTWIGFKNSEKRLEKLKSKHRY